MDLLHYSMKSILVVFGFVFAAAGVSAQKIIPKIGMSLYQASIHEKYSEYNQNRYLSV